MTYSPIIDLTPAHDSKGLDQAIKSYEVKIKKSNFQSISTNENVSPIEGIRGGSFTRIHDALVYKKAAKVPKLEISITSVIPNCCYFDKQLVFSQQGLMTPESQFSSFDTPWPKSSHLGRAEKARIREAKEGMKKLEESETEVPKHQNIQIINQSLNPEK